MDNDGIYRVRVVEIFLTAKQRVQVADALRGDSWKKAQENPG